MRRIWRALTARGHAFVVIGLLVAIAAVLAGQRDLLRVALLLLVLPLVAALLVARARLRLSCDRSAVPSQVTLGERLEGRLTVGQEGLLPAAIVLMEDRVPRELGARPRFAVDRAEGRWQREVRYPLHGMVRGRFRTGPLMVRTADPFGLVQLDRHFTAQTEVMVTPRVVPLHGLRGIGGGGITGEARPHQVAATGQDDVLIREYRQGDDVRRVHWPSTARRGELMVRREEQSWDPSASILIDSRLGSHAGSGVNGSFEWAVSAAASIGTLFCDEGFTVEMYEADGSLHLDRGAGDRAVATRQAMTLALTDIGLRRTPSLRHGLTAMAIDAAGQLMVAILGRSSAGDATALTEIRRLRTQGLAMIIDVDSFDPATVTDSLPPDGGPAAQVLRDGGWRVAIVRSRDTVDAIWSQLDRTVAGSTALFDAKARR